jgi:cobalt-zinc-cadmium efflux system membrane fusion protein
MNKSFKQERRNGMKTSVWVTRCAALGAALTLVAACDQSEPVASSCADTKCGDHEALPAACGAEAGGSGDGHGHAGGKDATISFEERANKPCEHKIPIYQCDECRYEANVVKLGPGILREGPSSGLVVTQAAARVRGSVVIPATGEIALNANATAHISPRVAGIIDSVAADIGGQVQTGETLLTLTSVELGRALAEYERNRALTELSEKVCQRELRLREQRVGSEQDVIQAQMTYEQHRTDLRASEQLLHVLGLTEEELARSGEPVHGTAACRMPVRAPFAGTIIERHAVSGELAEPGKDLLLLSDLSTVWVWADVHARDLAALLAAEKRAPVTIEAVVSAFPGRVFPGRLNYIGATMHEESRTVRVRATVENQERLLRPGMFCEVSLAAAGDQAEEALAVPATALFEDDGKTFVFKHWREQYFMRQDVRKGRAWAGLVEILGGLQAGEAIVTEGGFLLKSDLLREKMGAGCAD